MMSLSHVTGWLMNPHVRHLEVLPEKFVVAVTPAGAQLNTLWLVANVVEALMTMFAYGIGKLGCSQPSGKSHRWRSGRPSLDARTGCRRRRPDLAGARVDQATHADVATDAQRDAPDEADA
jgi:hypothetical protein